MELNSGYDLAKWRTLCSQTVGEMAQRLSVSVDYYNQLEKSTLTPPHRDSKLLVYASIKLALDQNNPHLLLGEAREMLRATRQLDLDAPANEEKQAAVSEIWHDARLHVPKGEAWYPVLMVVRGQHGLVPDGRFWNGTHWYQIPSDNSEWVGHFANEKFQRREYARNWASSHKPDAI